MISPTNNLTPHLHPIDTRIQLLVDLAYQHHIVTAHEIQPVFCRCIVLLVVRGTDYTLDGAGQN